MYQPSPRFALFGLVVVFAAAVALAALHYGLNPRGEVTRDNILGFLAFVFIGGGALIYMLVLVIAGGAILRGPLIGGPWLSNYVTGARGDFFWLGEVELRTCEGLSVWAEHKWGPGSRSRFALYLAEPLATGASPRALAQRTGDATVSSDVGSSYYFPQYTAYTLKPPKPGTYLLGARLEGPLSDQIGVEFNWAPTIAFVRRGPKHIDETLPLVPEEQAAALSGKGA